MMDGFWLVQQAARMASPHTRQLVLGTKEESEAAKAVSKAARQTALRLLPERASELTTEHLVQTVLEHVSANVIVEGGEIGDSVTEQLAHYLTRQFEPLFVETGYFVNLGVTASLQELVDEFMSFPVDALLKWTGRSSALMPYGLLLRIEMEKKQRTGTRNEDPRVVGWLTVESEPPQIEFNNIGLVPVFDVVATPMLLGLDLAGVVTAQVGGAPLYNSRARQVGPGYAYTWPLPHAIHFGGHPLVQGYVSFNFRDGQGRNYRYANGQTTME